MLALILKRLWGRLVGVPSGSGRLVIGPLLSSGRACSPTVSAARDAPEGTVCRSCERASNRRQYWLTAIPPANPLALSGDLHDGVDSEALVGQVGNLRPIGNRPSFVERAGLFAKGFCRKRRSRRVVCRSCERASNRRQYCLTAVPPANPLALRRRLITQLNPVTATFDCTGRALSHSCDPRRDYQSQAVSQ
jgi:hypothetical protein